MFLTYRVKVETVLLLVEEGEEEGVFLGRENKGKTGAQDREEGL